MKTKRWEARKQHNSRSRGGNATCMSMCRNACVCVYVCVYVYMYMCECVCVGMCLYCAGRVGTGKALSHHVTPWLYLEPTGKLLNPTIMEETRKSPSLASRILPCLFFFFPLQLQPVLSLLICAGPSLVLLNPPTPTPLAPPTFPHHGQRSPVFPGSTVSLQPLPLLPPSDGHQDCHS